MAYHVLQFLTLKTFVFITQHDVYSGCGAVDQQLTVVLLELPYFLDGICQALWSLLINSCCQSVCIPKSFYEYPNHCCIVIEVASVIFPFKLVYKCC